MKLDGDFTIASRVDIDVRSYRYHLDENDGDLISHDD